MTTLFSDDFENGLLAWTGTVSPPLIDSSIVHKGLSSLKANSGNQYAYKSGFNTTILHTGMFIYVVPTGINSEAAFLAIRNSAFTIITNVNITKSNRLRITCLNGEYTSEIACPINQWVWIELKVIVDAVNGEYHVWQDNVEVINVTGLNTSSIGNADIVCVGTQYANNCDVYMDDVIVADNYIGSPDIIVTPLAISITPTVATINRGESIKLTANGSGGNPPYTITWKDAETNLPIGSGEAYMFVPTQTGSYNINAEAIDSIGTTANSPITSITVNESPTPILTKIFNEGNDASGWVSGSATAVPTVDTVDVPPELTACIKCEETTNTQNWLLLVKVSPQDYMGYPLLSFPIKLSKAGSAFINVITTGWIEHRYPFTAPANTWVNIAIDLQTPDTKGEIINLAQVHAIRLDYEINRAPATARIGRIIFSGSGEMPPPQITLPETAKARLGHSVHLQPIINYAGTNYSVDWYLNDNKVTTSPTYDFAPPTEGQYAIKAVVTDLTRILSSESNICIVTAITASTPPNNPSPWHTVGHKIFDANNREVYIRSIGIMGSAPTGLWGGKGTKVADWNFKWNYNFTDIAQRMDENMACWKNYWYLNAIRIQGCEARWWWIDTVNMSTDMYNEGPDVNVSCRDYWELLAQRAKAAGMNIAFCVSSVLDYYTGNTEAVQYKETTGVDPWFDYRGGMPMCSSPAALAWLSTIDPDEITAWKKIWTSIVQRLGKYDNLMWELYNEPYPMTGDATTKQRYYNYMIEMYKTIRELGNNNIILIQWGEGTVPGGDELSWITEFHNQLRTAIGKEPTNIVYTTHCYRHAPAPLLAWATTYAGVKAQLESPTFVNITRTNGIDAPLYFDETGVMLGTGLTEQQRLEDLNWFSALLQASYELEVGINPEWWQPYGWQGTLWAEALLDQSNYWDANSESPTPTITGQIYIDSYVGDETPPNQGKLEVHSFLKSTEVVTQVEIVGMDSYDTPFSIDLDPNEYTLKCTIQNETKIETVTIEAGKKKRVDFIFSPTPQAASLLAPVIAVVSLIGIGFAYNHFKKKKGGR